MPFANGGLVMINSVHRANIVYLLQYRSHKHRLFVAVSIDTKITLV